MVRLVEVVLEQSVKCCIVKVDWKWRLRYPRFFTKSRKLLVWFSYNTSICVKMIFNWLLTYQRLFLFLSKPPFPVINKSCVIFQRIRSTVDEREQKHLLKELDIVMNSGDCPYIVMFYGALFKEVMTYVLFVWFFHFFQASFVYL